MTDHPVLIPTDEGAVGGIVSEPEGEARAALLLLAGHGRSARSGVDSFWTRTARSLAARGIVVLRVDYSREGETLPIGQGGSGLIWKHDLDLRLIRQVAAWFRARTGGDPLLLAGVCAGARLAIELAGGEPAAVAASFLIVPYIHDLATAARRQEGGDASLPRPGDPGTLDPHVVECFRATLERSPSWLLIGEHDETDIASLQARLGPLAQELELEVLPNVALHLLDRPYLQDLARPRLVDWVCTAAMAPFARSR